MGDVKFGVGLFPIEPIQRMLTLVKLAEEVGFSCAYIGDSQMIWREPYVLLGAAAMTTKRIILATGVTNPITRDLGVLAAAWASLHEMVGDRLLLGIGSGDSLGRDFGKEAFHVGQPGAIDRDPARADRRRDPGVTGDEG